MKKNCKIRKTIALYHEIFNLNILLIRESFSLHYWVILLSSYTITKYVAILKFYPNKFYIYLWMDSRENRKCIFSKYFDQINFLIRVGKLNSFQDTCFLQKHHYNVLEMRLRLIAGQMKPIFLLKCYATQYFRIPLFA